MPAFLFAGLFCAMAATSARAGEMKLEAQLIWGTNDEQAPSSDLKPVDEKVAKRLSNSPYKWKHYYVVSRKEFKIADKATTTLNMSKDLDVKVKNTGGDTVEVELVGKGKPVGKITQALGKGKCMVTGGNATNYTSWLVFMKQIE